jgi:hypothetical protein
MPITMMTKTLFLILVLLVPAAKAYASWLKCYVDLDSSEVVMNHPIEELEDAEHIVEIEVREIGTKKWTQEFVYPAKAETTIEARLKLPDGIERVTYQYVMETTAGAKFFQPDMCEGRRSFGRKVSEYVKLKIKPGQGSITLWAGYAKEFGVVSLTEKLVLRQEESTETATEL